MRRLLVVEDDADIRGSLVDYFAARGFVVDASETVAGAAERLAAERYTAVLLDLQLPDGDGLELLRGLRAPGADTPVLIVTARGAEAQRVRGLELGADDYVVKPFSVRELDARLEAVLRRSIHRPLPARLGSAEIDLDALEVRRGGETLRLLQKEAELLAYLLRNPSRAVDRAELLREVWGYDAYPTTRTVDTHVFNLRRKVEDAPEQPRHILTVHGVGYRLQP